VSDLLSSGLAPENWLGKIVDEVIDPYLLTDYVEALKRVNSTGVEKDFGRIPNTYTEVQRVLR
jgi:hypothetical protein